MINDLLKFFYTEPSDLDYSPGNEMTTAFIYDEIREIGDNIFTSNIDPKFYKETAEIFLKDIDTLLQDTPDGKRLVWEESLVAHLPALDENGDQIILRPSMLPSKDTGFFIWDEGKKKSSDELTDQWGNEGGWGYFQGKGSPFIFVHDDDGNNGIMPVSLMGDTMPEGINLGYKSSGTGDVIKGVYLSDEGGGLLLSQIGLISETFYAKGKEWFKDPLAIPNHINPNYEIEINGKVVMVPRLIYYRSSTRQTGNHIHGFLQKVVSTMVPRNTYKPLIKAEVSLTSRLKSILKSSEFSYRFEFDRDFSSKQLFEILSLLPTVAQKGSSGAIDSTALNLLKYFNGRFIGKKTLTNFIPGPDKIEINDMIRALEFTALELKRLAWKNSDNTFIGANQYLKEWLMLIYNKIMTYDKTQPNADTSIIREQEKLTDLRDNHATTYSELVTSIEPEKCTPKEWNMAISIFESASKLFGHGTVRLMLSNMVNFNKDKSIKIYNTPPKGELAAIHNHIGFASMGNLPISDYTTIGNFYEHMVGIFLLDSHVIIPRTDIIINSKENSYIFPFGPITFNNPTEIVEANTIGSFSWSLAKKISGEFKIYMNSKTKIDSFISSQTNLYNAFSDLLDEQIIDQRLYNNFNTPEKTWKERKGMNIWLSRRTKQVARTELFSIQSGGLRNNIDEFRALFDYLTDIPFNVLKAGATTTFSLSLTQPFLENIDYLSWPKDAIAKLIEDSYQRFKDENIENFFDQTRKIISEFGTDGKKVLIQPIFSTNDPDLGYQHLISAENLAKKRWLPREKTVFEVDLTKPEEAHYVLEHIAHLMATFNIAFVFREWIDLDTDPRYKDIYLRTEKMKKYFEDNQEVITAVDFEGYLRIDEIYSGSSSGEQVLLNGYTTNSEGKTFFDAEVFKTYDEWDKVWKHKMGFFSISFGKFNFNALMSGTSDQANTLREILDPTGTRFRN